MKFRCLLIAILLLAIMQGCLSQNGDKSFNDTDSTENGTVKIKTLNAYEIKYNVRYKDFLFDFENFKIYVYVSYEYKNRYESNTHGNNGYQRVIDIDKNKFDDVQDKLAEISINLWDSNYRKYMQPNTHYWGVDILYDNNKYHKTVGVDEYPEKWDEVNHLLSELAGFDVWVVLD